LDAAAARSGGGDGAFQVAGEDGGEGTRDAGGVGEGWEVGVGVDAGVNAERARQDKVVNAECARQDEVVNADRARQDALSRKMRGLKKKRRKFTRTLSGHVPSGSDQKDSSFNYAAYRELNDILPSANAQQIRAATTPAKARSPLSKVKRDRSALKASLEASSNKQRRLEWSGERNEKKIADLKTINNQLMQDVLRERRASNKLIEDAMFEARKLSTEALEMMREASLKMADVDHRIISVRNCATAQIREERLFQSRESARLQKKLCDTIDKLHREQDASMKISKVKSDKKY
jgi:hypothetical protein